MPQCIPASDLETGWTSLSDVHWTEKKLKEIYPGLFLRK
jgi:hypothetical protein